MPTVIIVGGPAGTGKTTTATLLAKHFDCPFVEGDDLHPPANIAKMSRGEPLTDDDRWGWLEALGKKAAAMACDPENASGVCVASCLMLKRTYRELLKKVGQGATFRFVFLHTLYEQLMQRVEARQGHYMKLDMVKSQYEIMEIPSGDELVVNGGDALAVDNGAIPAEDLQLLILQQLGL